MNYDIVSIDRNALPNALLAPFKRWQRVTFCDDDILITEILQGAIDQFERNSEITVFKTTIVLEPESTDYACGSGNVLRLPVTPINTIQVLTSAVPHSDESLLSDGVGYVGTLVVLNGGDYVLKARGIHGVRIYSLFGSFVDGMTITIETGFTETTITPEIRQALFQIAGHFYEYREILNATNVGEPSMWLNQIMSGFWLPRA